MITIFNKMKKVIFAIALMLTLGFAANAQDGFFRGNSDGEVVVRSGEGSFNVSLPDQHGGSGDVGAPLGSGLLILTALGAGYAMKKKLSK